MFSSETETQDSS